MKVSLFVRAGGYRRNLMGLGGKTWSTQLPKGIAGGDVGADHLYTLRDDGPSEKMNAEYTDTGLGNAQY